MVWIWYTIYDILCHLFYVCVAIDRCKYRHDNTRHFILKNFVEFLEMLDINANMLLHPHLRPDVETWSSWHSLALDERKKNTSQNICTIIYTLYFWSKGGFESFSSNIIMLTSWFVLLMAWDPCNSMKSFLMVVPMLFI